MPALTPEQSRDLVDRGFDLLRDAADLTSGDAAEYIRDGNPESLFDALPLAAARQGCRRYADKGGDYPARRAARAERACRPYLDSLDYNDPPQVKLPFRGGQCAAVYVVSATQTTNLSGTSNITFRALGPIGGVRLVQVSGNNYDWEVFCSGANFASSTCGTMPPGAPGWVRIGGVNSSDGNQTTSITSITPCGADNCGNPPPEYSPPSTPAIPGPPREPFTRVPDIDIDIEVEVNVDGSLDIDIGTGPINIDPFDDPEPEDGGGVDGGDLVPDGGTAGDPADTGDGGTAAGCAPSGQELVGVRVEVLERPIGFNQYANNPAEVIRGIGYVRMGYPNRLALDMGGAAVISPQFFLAPVRGLTCWEVRANLGFINRVTPFYRELPQ
jgi:hypothetical protein